MIVGCRRHCCYLGDRSIVYFRELEDHSGWRSSSPLFPSLLQGPNLLKGDTLWGWRLWVGGGRLGLVSTWRAARTWAGTAGRAGIQDNTTWKSRAEQKESVHWSSSRSELTCTIVSGSAGIEQHSTLILWAYLADLHNHIQKKQKKKKTPRSCRDNRNLILWVI